MASALPLLTSLMDVGFSKAEWADRGSIMNCAVGVDELLSSLSYKRETGCVCFLCSSNFTVRPPRPINIKFTKHSMPKQQGSGS